MLKKLLIAATALGISTLSQQALANNTAKIHFVKQAYKDAIYCHNTRTQNNSCSTNNDPIYKYVNQGLRNAVDLASEQRVLMARTGCNWDIDSALLGFSWNIDSNIALVAFNTTKLNLNSFKFTTLSNGNVRVSHPSFQGRHSEVVLTRSGNSYKIGDIRNAQAGGLFEDLMGCAS